MGEQGDHALAWRGQEIIQSSCGASPIAAVRALANPKTHEPLCQRKEAQSSAASSSFLSTTPLPLTISKT